MSIAFGGIEQVEAYRSAQRNNFFEIKSLKWLNEQLKNAQVMRRNDDNAIMLEFSDDIRKLTFKELIHLIKEYVQMEESFPIDSKKWSKEAMLTCIHRIHRLNTSQNEMERLQLGRIGRIFCCALYPPKHFLAMINPFKNYLNLKEDPGEGGLWKGSELF